MLGLYPGESEPIIKEVERQMNLDALILKKAVFDIVNLMWDKGTGKKRLLNEIKSESRKLDREISKEMGEGWLKGISAH